MRDLSDVLLLLSPFTWASAVVILADLAAWTSIWRSRKHALRTRLIWTVMVGVLPVLGAIAWFALGRVPRRYR